jgi:glycerol-3-phosphate dehydrogenase
VTAAFDLAVIGGGINGTGIARDATGRGLSVLLVEQGDLGGATSSASTKLIHGGLRYLEYGEFRLVREALAEREVLLRAAPHIIRPLRFVLPHHAGLRPWWLIRTGLLVYDHLGARKLLPPTRALDLTQDEAGAPLQPRYRRAFEYSDCRVDDARLVVLNARDAAMRGAEIRPRTRCVRARVEEGAWTLDFADGGTAHARVLVNAAGPWVVQVLTEVAARAPPAPLRLVKGSHIVVPRLFAHERCYVFQNGDDRICFAVPYEQDFTLIGTTDEDFGGNPGDALISAEEEAYLCSAVNAYFRRPVTQADIVWRYCGVRPLRDEGGGKAQEATRDYVLEFSAADGSPPLLSVFGGKITTYRRLAEAAMAKLAPFFPGMGHDWTAGAPLPGGNFAWDGLQDLTAGLCTRFPFIEESVLTRMARCYGTLTAEVLGDARSAGDLGCNFGQGLTERELDWLMRHEWAREADDILWRRTKLGLRLTQVQKGALAEAMAGTHITSREKVGERSRRPP